MSWLGERPYPHKETLRRLWEAYSERYDFYVSLGVDLSHFSLAKLMPPEFPVSVGGMKNYMRDFAEAITVLLQRSLDTRKLGDWQIRDPFEGFGSYELSMWDALGVDGKAFFCKDVPMLISDCRIVEAWYKVLNDYIRYPQLPVEISLSGDHGIGYSGSATLTDWTDDNKYGGDRTVELDNMDGFPYPDYNDIAAYHYKSFRQSVTIDSVVNTTSYPTYGAWTLCGRITGMDEFENGSRINSIPGTVFDIAMNGLTGTVTLPENIAEIKRKILSYAKDAAYPTNARLIVGFRFGDTVTGKLYKVSAENLPDPQYKYLDS